jgi:glycosyltransferase involved in cell wall biosynthesis
MNMILNESDQFPRVLAVDLSKDYGGANSRILTIMKHFSPHHIALAGLADSPVINKAIENGLSIHIVGSHKVDPLIFPRLVHIIRQFGYQVVDTQNIQSKFWGSMASSITGTALVSTLNSWYMDEHRSNRIKGLFYTVMELLTNYRTDRYITVSNIDRKSLIDSKINGNMVDLIPNAIDIDPKSIPGNPESLRLKFNFPPDAIVCTAVGRLVWAKGYHDFIDAFSQVAEQNSRIFGLIIGEGQLRDSLRDQVNKLGLQNRVLLPGYSERETALSILKASDIFVLPSKHEGTPIALLEAAALGLPILATTCGGIPDVVTDGEQAILVPVGDPSALADGILKLCNDPIFAKSLGEKAQKKVRQLFNPKRQVQAIKRSYLMAWEHRLHRA